eukprot:PhM_4_TR6749/c0_g1_i1/m.71776
MLSLARLSQLSQRLVSYLSKEAKSVPLFMWVYLLCVMLLYRHLMRTYLGTGTVTRRILGRVTAKLSKEEDTVAGALIEPASLTQSFADVGGLVDVKQALLEGIVWPLNRPDLFPPGTLRSPNSGVLLYGPPGTGKTLLARALAKEIDCSFLEVRLDMIFTKWVGDTEKIVNAIFSVARKVAPCVIFVDEVDAILSQRQSSEQPVYAHVKSLFMTQWEGLRLDPTKRIIVVAATNRPGDIDDAILRRMPLKLSVPYPDSVGRRQILGVLLSKEDVCGVDMAELVRRTDGFSGSDLRDLCQEAAMMPVREALRNGEGQEQSKPRHVPLGTQHFVEALRRVQPNNNFVQQRSSTRASHFRHPFS